MFKRTISTFGLCLAILFSSLVLSGCSERPFLKQDASYTILSVSPSGVIKSEPIELPWDSNLAIMQKFLLEVSFVLSDLRTPSDQDPSNQDTLGTTSLQANFPEPKRMTFIVDGHSLPLDVQSLQIEVEGENVGQVIINQTIILQGINDPNLQSAYEALVNMLHNKKS
ncbi:MAG: hypothetical protein P4L49_20020 [Desulfosporosinus sp.]|nr:hypothetical protein [Desulfosporosinus sp.]